MGWLVKDWLEWCFMKKGNKFKCCGLDEVENVLSLSVVLNDLDFA